MENLPAFKCCGLTVKPWLNAQDRDSTHQAIESTEEFGGSRRIALLLFIRLCRMTLPARNEHSAFRPFRACGVARGVCVDVNLWPFGSADFEL